MHTYYVNGYDADDEEFERMLEAKSKEDAKEIVEASMPGCFVLDIIDLNEGDD